MSPKIKKANPDDYRPQGRNANGHTQRGMGMLDNSMSAVGWIGGATAAANGEMFDGSARLEKGVHHFGDRLYEIESDGTEMFIIKRTDIPDGTHPTAVKAGILANRTAEVNLDWQGPVLLEANDSGAIDIDEVFFPDELAAILETNLKDAIADESEGGIGDREKKEFSCVCPNCHCEFIQQR